MLIRILIFIQMLALCVFLPAGESLAAKVKMDAYTVETPSGKGWKVNKHEAPQVVEIAKRLKPGEGATAMMIVVVPQSIVGMYGTVHSEQWLGDDIRLREQANMIAMGVMPGMYELQDVKKFNIRIGDKAGYAMRYDQVFPFEQTHGYLFVYFPADFEEHGTFYKFVCSLVGTDGASEDLDLKDFYAVVDSLETR